MKPSELVERLARNRPRGQQEGRDDRAVRAHPAPASRPPQRRSALPFVLPVVVAAVVVGVTLVLFRMTDPGEDRAETPALQAQAVSRQSAPEHGGTLEPVRGRSYLGIRGKEVRRGQLKGVSVLEVFPDSPAAAAGLRAAPTPSSATPDQPGHTIVGANGRPVRSEYDLQQLLKQSTPGAVVKFVVTTGVDNAYEVIPVTLGTVPGEEQWRKLEQEISYAVNAVRATVDAPPLRDNPALAEVARRHSEEMAARRAVFHLAPDDTSVIDRLWQGGVADFTAAAENLFHGEVTAEGAEMLVRQWAEDARDQKNLLDPRYTEGGVGVAQGEAEELYVTQVYVRR